MIVGNQIATNKQHGLFIDAWTGSTQCNAARTNVITGNQFVTGSGTGYSNNTYDAILIRNSGNNTVAANVTNNPNGGVTYKNAVEFQQPSATESTDNLVGNNLQGWATAGCVTLASTYALGNSNCNSAITSGSLDVTTSSVSATVVTAGHGAPCTNGELALGSGWGSTASVSAAKGLSQTCEWTITANGSGIAANPQITDNLVNGLTSNSTVCDVRMVGGTGTTTLIDQTTLSSTAPVFTFGGTPAAGATYKVVRRCGP